AFKRSFSELFSEEWREIILSEKPNCNMSGDHKWIGNHDIHFGGYNDDWKIISINGAEIEELGKIPVLGGWIYKEKILGSFCFSQDSWSGEGGDLPVDLSLCQKSITIPNISIDEVGTVTECYEDEPSRCLKTYYGLYMKIPVQKCKIIAPNVSDNCMEIGLVRISAESGGSIGYLTTVTIYGIIKDPITDKVFMTPLVDFDSLNEALNYIDALEK
ncbi:MAG: hypothetical protein VCA36_07585, partial [Opitutales bacterium]